VHARFFQDRPPPDRFRCLVGACHWQGRNTVQAAPWRSPETVQRITRCVRRNRARVPLRLRRARQPRLRCLRVQYRKGLGVLLDGRDESVQSRDGIEESRSRRHRFGDPARERGGRAVSDENVCPAGRDRHQIDAQFVRKQPNRVMFMSNPLRSEFHRSTNGQHRVTDFAAHAVARLDHNYGQAQPLSARSCAVATRTP